MTLTQEQISRLAQLCALHVDGNQEIDSVLASIETISTANTDSVWRVSRSGNNILTPVRDEIYENVSLWDALLACSPQKVSAHQIVLAGIMHGE